MNKRNGEPDESGTRELDGERFGLEFDTDPGDEARTPSERADDRLNGPEDPDEELEPGNEELPEGDEEGEPEDLDALKRENARLRQAHREALRMKSNAEEARRENRFLRRQLDRMSEVRGDTVRRPQPEYEEEGIDEAVASLRVSDSPEAKLIRVMSQEILKLTRRQAQLEDRSRTRIPEADEEAVEKLMASGEFGSRRAAYRALLGDRLLQLRRRKRQLEDSGEEERPARREAPPAREPERKPRVGSVTRPIGQREANSRTISAAKFSQAMDKGGPAARKLYQDYKDQKITVTP